MEDRELEASLRQALAADTEPSEPVWQKLRKPDPRWVPSFAETSFAVLAGVVALTFIAGLKPAQTHQEPVARQAPVIERTFVASIRTGTTLR